MLGHESSELCAGLDLVLPGRCSKPPQTQDVDDYSTRHDEPPYWPLARRARAMPLLRVGRHAANHARCASVEHWVELQGAPLTTAREAGTPSRPVCSNPLLNGPFAEPR